MPAHDARKEFLIASPETGLNFIIEVCAHAVHTDADEAEILGAEVERAVEVTFLLTSAFLCASQVQQEMRSGDVETVEESNALGKLIATRDSLVVIEVIGICRIVVLLNVSRETHLQGQV
jgi:hypothetical protein